MPTYEYECKTCGGVWEMFEPPSAPKGSCPKCRSRRIFRRIGTGSAILFKGEGFRTNRKARQESKFMVTDQHPNKRVGVPLEKGIVRRGRKEDRPGTGRRGGRGSGNSKYVRGASLG